CVPRLDNTVLAQRVKRLAVRRVDQTGNRTFMGEIGVDDLAALRGHLPDADALVHAPRREVTPARTPGNGVNPVGRFAAGIQELASFAVVNVEGGIRRAGSEQLAVRAEGQAVNGVAVVFERPQFLAAGDLPQLDKPIIAAAGEQFAVRTESDLINNVFM